MPSACGKWCVPPRHPTDALALQPASKASATRGRRACPQRARRTGAAATDSRAREDAQLDDMAENDPDAYKKFMEEQMKEGSRMSEGQVGKVRGGGK